MNKRLFAFMIMAVLAVTALSGCGSSKTAGEGNTAGGVGAQETSTEAEERMIPSSDLLKDLDYDPSEYVVLPKNYNSLSVEVEGDYTFTEEKFKELINQYLSSMTTYEPTDKEVVEDGDAVNIDYEGKVDGKTFDGGSAEGYDLVIGSNSFIEGFETGLIGKKKGETVDLDLAFPDDYQLEDLAGKKVVFTVTINSINKVVSMTYETLTDDYVKENLSYYGYSTKDEFLDAEKELYQKDLENQKKQAVVSAYDSKLFEETDFSNLPEDLLNKEYEKQKKSLESYAKQNNMSAEEYLESAGYTEDKFRESVENNYKRGIMYQALIKEMAYTLNASEVDEEIANYVQNYGMTEEQFFEQFGGKEEVYRQMAYSHIMEDLADEAESNGRVKVKAAGEETAKTSPKVLYILAALAVLVVLITVALLTRSGKTNNAEENKEEPDPSKQEAGLTPEENEDTEPVISDLQEAKADFSDDKSAEAEKDSAEGTGEESDEEAADQDSPEETKKESADQAADQEVEVEEAETEETAEVLTEAESSEEQL